MGISLFDSTIDGLSNALAVHQRRHQVLASNLANVETPGYRAQELDFAKALKQAFPDKTGADALAGPPEPPKVIDDTSAPSRSDGNTVDLDLQMAKLATNSARYNTLAKLLSKHFAALRQAVDGVR